MDWYLCILILRAMNNIVSNLPVTIDARDPSELVVKTSSIHKKQVEQRKRHNWSLFMRPALLAIMFFIMVKPSSATPFEVADETSIVLYTEQARSDFRWFIHDFFSALWSYFPDQFLTDVSYLPGSFDYYVDQYLSPTLVLFHGLFSQMRTIMTVGGISLVSFFNPAFVWFATFTMNSAYTSLALLLKSASTPPRFVRKAVKSVSYLTLSFYTFFGIVLSPFASFFFGTTAGPATFLFGSFSLLFSVSMFRRSVIEALSYFTEPSLVWSPTYGILSRFLTISRKQSVAISFVETVVTTSIMFMELKSTLGLTSLLTTFVKSLHHISRDAMEKIHKITTSLLKPYAASSGIIKHLTAIVGALTIIPLLAGGDLKKALRVYDNFVKTSAKTESISDGIVSAFEYIKDRAGYILFDIPFDQESFDIWFKEVSAFIDDVTPFHPKLQQCPHRFDRAVWIKDRVHYFQNESIKFDILKEGSTPNTHYRHILTSLKSIESLVGTELIRSRMRRFPMGVHITGLPGVGKSWLAKRVFDLYAGLFTKPTSSDNIYKFPSAENFMSGYRMQWAILLDDINATHPTVVLDKKMTKILDLFQNFTTDSEQAALEAKGAIPIVSELIVATSNDMSLNASSVYRTPDAIHRRFPLVIEHLLREEYLNDEGLLDSARVRGHEVDAFYFHVYVPRATGVQSIDPRYTRGAKNNKHHVQVPSPSGNSFWTLPELFTHVKEVFMKHYAEQTVIVDSLETSDFCDKCMNIRTLCGHVREYVEPKSDPELVEVPTASIMETVKANISEKMETSFPYAIAVAGIGALATKYAYDYYKRGEPEAQEDNDFWYRGSELVFNHIQRSTASAKVRELTLANSYVVCAKKTGSPNIAWVNAIYLGNFQYLTVSHVFEGQDEVYLIPPHQGFGRKSDFATQNVFIKQLKIVNLGNDRVIFTFPGMKPKTKGLYEHLAPSSIYGKDVNTYGVAHVFRLEDEGYDEYKMIGKPVWKTITYHGEATSYTCDVGLLPVSSPIAPGTCGSPIWVPNPNGAGQFIVGIVCAGIPLLGTAGFTPVDQTLVEPAAEIIPLSVELSSPYFKHDKVPFYQDSSWIKNPGFCTPKYTVTSRATPRSKCSKSYFYDYLKSQGFNVDKWQIPIFKLREFPDGRKDFARSPSARAVLKMKRDRFRYDPDILEKVLLDYAKQIEFIASKCDCSPMTIEEAINSSEYLHSLSMNTSCGFPNYGPKSKYIVWNSKTNKFEATPELIAAVNEILYQYSIGNSVSPVFTATPKDEVVTEEKNIIGKIRYFQNIMLPFLIVQRIFSGRFSGHYKNLRGVSLGHAYGMNHLLEWDTMVKSIISFGGGILHMDYKEYDGYKEPFMRRRQASIFADVMLKYGHFTPEHVGMFKTKSFDESFPTICLRGDVATVCGGTMSGEDGTTIGNNFDSHCYMRYAWYGMGFEKPFDENVLLFVYGDDIIGASREPRFNMISISQYLRDCNIILTNPDGSAITEPFGDIQTATFLGRSFSLVDGTYSARLDPESILRSLAWRSPSTALTDSMHAYCALESARYELSRHLVDPTPLGSRLIGIYDHLRNLLIDEGYSVPLFPSREECLFYVKSGTFSPVDPEDEESCIAFCAKFVPLSAEGADIKQEQGTTIFHDQAPEPLAPTLSMNVNPYPFDDRFDLASSLSRPLLIHTASVAVGATVNIELDVIPLFFANSFVADKMRNFTLCRATTMLRVMTNGTVFHYSLAKAGWRPRSDFSTQNSTLMAVSQYPGPVAGIDFSRNPVFEMAMPFVSPVNYWNITEVLAGVDTVTPRNTFTLRGYCPVGMSNGGTTPVEISIYAWFERESIELIIPKPIATSGKGPDPKGMKKVVDTAHHFYDSVVKDERDPDGPISTYTSAAASAAGYLTSVPVVGEYATLVQSGLSLATKGLSYFGLSRPTILGSNSKMVQRPIGNMSHAYDQDDCEPVSLDPQVAVTKEGSNFSPTSVDQMTFSNLTRRWSYVDTFSVLSTDVAGDTIFQWGVNPIASVSLPGDGTPTTFTTLAHTAYPHLKWGGDLEIMLWISHAKNQNFRFLASYNPEINFHPSLPSNDIMNIIIESDNSADGRTCVVINIPWSNAKPYLDVAHVVGSTFMDSTSIIYNPSTMNGSFDLSILNPLVSPAPSTIYVNVFVRAGPGFRLAVPDQSVYNNFAPMAGVGEDIKIKPFCDTNLPYDLATGFENPCDVTYLGAPPDMEATLSYPGMFFGEALVSWRAVVKRFAYWAGVDLTPTYTGAGTITVHVPPRPLPKFRNTGALTTTSLGLHNYGGNTTGTVANGFITNTTHISWVRPCFYCERGGMRWKCPIATNDTNADRPGVYWVQRGDASYNYNTGVNFPVTTEEDYNTSSSKLFYFPNSTNSSFPEGFAATTMDNNKSLNFTIPYYSGFKFLSTGGSTLLPNSSGSMPITDYPQMAYRLCKDMQGSDVAWIKLYVAAADDYDLNFFICTPIVYITADWP